MSGISNSNHVNVRKTHCPRGHEYSGENLYFSKNANGSTSRKCKACNSMARKIKYDTVIRAKMGYKKRENVKDYILHSVWGRMLDRCRNTNNKDYNIYGGRGITVCARWKKYNNFYDDMILGYEKGLTLDRINSDGNYEPSNCRWATVKQQSNNRRSNHKITFNGITQNLQQWSEQLGIKAPTIRYRLRNGWSVNDALTKEIM